MTDEELKAIEVEIERHGADCICTAADHAKILFSEVSRLRAMWPIACSYCGTDLDQE